MFTVQKEFGILFWQSHDVNFSSIPDSITEISKTRKIPELIALTLARRTCKLYMQPEWSLLITSQNFVKNKYCNLSPNVRLYLFYKSSYMLLNRLRNKMKKAKIFVAAHLYTISFKYIYIYSITSSVVVQSRSVELKNCWLFCAERDIKIVSSTVIQLYNGVPTDVSSPKHMHLHRFISCS